MKIVDSQAKGLHVRLAQAIGQRVEAGETVPCVADPVAWDDEENVEALEACGTCPVLHVCRPLALTGLVKTGIVAGMSMPQLAARRDLERRRGRRRQRRVEPVAA